MECKYDKYCQLKGTCVDAKAKVKEGHKLTFKLTDVEGDDYNLEIPFTHLLEHPKAVGS